MTGTTSKDHGLHGYLMTRTDGLWFTRVRYDTLHRNTLHGDVMIILHHDRDPSNMFRQIPHYKTTVTLYNLLKTKVAPPASFYPIQ